MMMMTTKVNYRLQHTYTIDVDDDHYQSGWYKILNSNEFLFLEHIHLEALMSSLRFGHVFFSLAITHTHTHTHYTVMVVVVVAVAVDDDDYDVYSLCISCRFFFFHLIIDLRLKFKFFFYYFQSNLGMCFVCVCLSASILGGLFFYSLLVCLDHPYK